jgi:hypothetical protein
VHELPVQSLDYLGVIQDDFGDECPRLKITPPFTFEEIAFGAHDRTTSEQLGQIRHAVLPGLVSLLA